MSVHGEANGNAWQLPLPAIVKDVAKKVKVIEDRATCNAARLLHSDDRACN